MATEIARDAWVRHDFVETRLHLRRSRQRSGDRVHIQRRISEPEGMKRFCTVLFIVNDRHGDHSAILRRIHAETPGSQIGDRLLPYGKRRREFSHRQEWTLVDLHANKFVISQGQGEDEPFVIRLNFYSKSLFGLCILNLERPYCRLVDPPSLSGEHSNDPPDSDVRLDDSLLRHSREFTHTGLQKDTHDRTSQPKGVSPFFDYTALPRSKGIIPSGTPLDSVGRRRYTRSDFNNCSQYQEVAFMITGPFAETSETRC